MVVNTISSAGIYEKFASLFASAVQDMRVGNGLEEGVIQVIYEFPLFPSIFVL